MKRPLVVSLNPAIDAEWRVDCIRWEEKNVVRSIRRWAGGKGANVTRWLRYLHQDPCLLLPLGGADGKELAAALKEERLQARAIPICESTRVNVVITGDDGRQMRFNPPGPKLTRKEWELVFASIVEWFSRTSVLILSGGLPRQAPAETYARLIARAHRGKVMSVLDCDGRALIAGVKAKPFLIKPNEHELRQWANDDGRSGGALVKAAFRMSGKSKGWVLVSRGPKGAMLVNAVTGYATCAAAPPVKILNTVGVGDALLAAVCCKLAAGSAPDEWLRWGVAVGTAATQVRGGGLPQWNVIKRLYKKVQVTPF